MKNLFITLVMIFSINGAFAFNCEFSESFTSRYVTIPSAQQSRPLNGGYLPLFTKEDGSKYVLGMEEWSGVRRGKVISVCLLGADHSCQTVKTDRVYYGEALAITIEGTNGRSDIEIDCK